jgi:antibiotic biosynthesis monooxygenase (ABM) superfamily enzyme
MEVPMNETTRRPTGPSRHQLALMVWMSVLPTLTVLQLALGGLLRELPPGLRVPIMATLAVPLVVYVVMPQLQRLHARLIKE